ncbi:PREDICTED: meiotic recombination protein REC8 homolog [Nanorana parkeri]|uniref:meiotic recombination protein REC8 homolog n=1 Tax=Nanorana parkeri TaxID=125878 RepID=UPI000854E5A0|nr:PREDICTED: meiotic recombination protein REC8 homolog [Nanorana parkeri]
MFYFPNVLQRHTGCFSTVWLAATKGTRIVKREYLKVNVMNTCRKIMQYILQQVPPPYHGCPIPRLSLYLSAQLSYGVVCVYHRQCDLLIEEMKVTLERLYKSENQLKIDLLQPDQYLLLPDSLILMQMLEDAPDPFFGMMEVPPELPNPYMIPQIRALLETSGPELVRYEKSPPRRRRTSRREAESDHLASPEAITMREEEPILLPPVEIGQDLPELSAFDLELLASDLPAFPEAETLPEPGKRGVREPKENGLPEKEKPKKPQKEREVKKADERERELDMDEIERKRKELQEMERDVAKELLLEQLKEIERLKELEKERERQWEAEKLLQLQQEKERERKRLKECERDIDQIRKAEREIEALKKSLVEIEEERRRTEGEQVDDRRRSVTEARRSPTPGLPEEMVSELDAAMQMEDVAAEPIALPSGGISSWDGQLRWLKMLNLEENWVKIVSIDEGARGYQSTGGRVPYTYANAESKLTFFLEGAPEMPSPQQVSPQLRSPQLVVPELADRPIRRPGRRSRLKIDKDTQIQSKIMQKQTSNPNVFTQPMGPITLPHLTLRTAASLFESPTYEQFMCPELTALWTRCALLEPLQYIREREEETMSELEMVRAATDFGVSIMQSSELSLEVSEEERFKTIIFTPEEGRALSVQEDTLLPIVSEMPEPIVEMPETEDILLEDVQRKLYSQIDGDGRAEFLGLTPQSYPRMLVSRFFYNCLVLCTQKVIRMEQTKPYGRILITSGRHYKQD